MQYLEVEIKFLLADPFQIRKQIIASGISSLGKVYENNIRYDTPDEALFKKGCLLRLRKDKAVRLTFKSPPDVQADDEFKRFNELETGVADFETMDMILKSIGYKPVQRYEKYRETFRTKDIELVIDAMPYGNFLEIEGPEDQIRDMADRLNLDWRAHGTATYLEMFHTIKSKKHLNFNDITFDHFKDLDVRDAIYPFFNQH